MRTYTNRSRKGTGVTVAKRRRGNAWDFQRTSKRGPKWRSPTSSSFPMDGENTEEQGRGRSVNPFEEEGGKECRAHFDGPYIR